MTLLPMNKDVWNSRDEIRPTALFRIFIIKNRGDEVNCR
jgi:hypothetical protein